MTIIVMGHIKAAAAHIAGLRAAMSAMVAATNAEEGCEHYRFSLDPDDSGVLYINERWASPEALAAHSGSDHMKTFNRAVGAAKLIEVSVKAWDGQFRRTLIGD